MVRAALINAGDRVSGYQGAFARVPEISCVAVVESNVATARQHADQLATSVYTSSLDELLQRHAELVQAVIIHSPLGDRASQIALAAEAGKHIFVQAPVGISVDEARAVVAACDRAGVHLMIGHPARCMPYQQTVRQALRAGKLGRAGLVRIHHWMARGSSGAQPQVEQDETRSLRAVDEVDIACWLFEEQPTRVYAMPSSENCATQIHLGFPSGGMALIDSGAVLPPGSDPYYTLSLIGSRGAVYADDHHNINLHWQAGTTSARNVGQGQEHVRRQLQHFSASLRAGPPPSTPRSVQDATSILSVMQAVQESSAGGRAAWLVGGRYELQ